MTSHSYGPVRFPAEVMQHAVRLYYCFSLGQRDVELKLFAPVPLPLIRVTRPIPDRLQGGTPRI